ncbi:MAG TPA: hypothetical protein VEP90_23190 [Methylomirabilota bacterium]|nr:hypothetical protein [Methylomirabilota bacterium]
MLSNSNQYKRQRSDSSQLSQPSTQMDAERIRILEARVAELEAKMEQLLLEKSFSNAQKTHHKRDAFLSVSPSPYKKKYHLNELRLGHNSKSV